MKRLAATLLAAVAAGAATQARAELVLDLTSETSPATCSRGANGTTFGWAFNVNAPITIDGIGVWDDARSGSFSSEAGLWTSGGSLLESATITTASSTPVASAASSDGQWLFESFAPITLSVGSYLIGNVVPAGTYRVAQHPNVTIIPQITYIQGEVGSIGGGFEAPTEEQSRVFGPTLEFAPAPEPATWAMVILGLGIVGGAVRHRHNRRALSA